MDTATAKGNTMAQTLAAYATSLKYEEIPADVRARAKACIIAVETNDRAIIAAGFAAFGRRQ